jgi:hypothetical protein
MTKRGLMQGEGGEEVATGDLLVLAPWLIFGAGIAVIGYVLLSSRGKSNGRRRHGR